MQIRGFDHETKTMRTQCWTEAKQRDMSHGLPCLPHGGLLGSDVSLRC